ncbi:MAG: response regulator [Rhodopirellula sp.]|nr:response regulator [Rhodopirellula sp.]
MDKLRVLVTDDEPGMRLGVSRTLRDFTVRIPDVDGDVAFAVEQAETGEAALEIIERSPPDILLLDHKMPGMSGLDVLDRLAGMSLDMLTIMITAYASIETAVTATKRGAYDFLAKPFTPDELKNTVRKTAARLILAKQARRLAEEKRQVRFQFIRVLGHELKAPLNAIDGYLQMIKDRTLGDDLSAYGESVERSMVRIEGMRKLIADLLDMTQIESGNKNRRLEAVDLPAVARLAAETLAPQAAAREIMLEIHGDPSVVMTADRSEMEMIFNNLLSNAIKYNRQGGRVDATLSKANDRVTIQVADTGIGMSGEEVERLFGEFVRIRNEKTRDILGSGLGLSIVKKLATLYGGETAVESRPGEGSTFSVTVRDQG